MSDNLIKDPKHFEINTFLGNYFTMNEEEQKKELFDLLIKISKLEYLKKLVIL